MIHKKRLGKEEALQKLRQYCAYQERCHKEVKEKLFSLGLGSVDVEEAISVLIGENYLNEERFARQFAGGRFRMKHWGRVKIVAGLKQKGISAYCIQEAMKEIDEGEYEQTLIRLAERKSSQITKEGPQKRQKIADYLLQKGYEANVVYKTIASLAGK